ncbi:hypothetical protein OVA29_08600 [Exiguobacterium sp. SL14]|nr:hypothetical protein [Exiguobacterium sp. SL14]MCY1690714.1 hypothetical protein [Exiguobacterium sp. SL14]
MNIFDAMKEIASGSIQFAEFKLQEGVIRMRLDDAGYMTKMVRASRRTDLSSCGHTATLSIRVSSGLVSKRWR